MNDINKSIIDAVIKKADAMCPNSLALIGVYGSVATRDEHEKSDLDLMILINDEKGWVLADGFILDDIDVGYDIYCTSWNMLERDAQCNHAHLSKLFDSMIVYCKDQSALKKLDEMKRKQQSFLRQINGMKRLTMHIVKQKNVCRSLSYRSFVKRQKLCRSSH